MRSWLYAGLLGLVGAGILHVVVVLLLPAVSDRSAWAALSSPLGATERLATTGEDPSPLAGSVDPLFQAVACRFDLEEGPRRISGPMRSPYWSLSVYDPLGTNFYSLNDRTAPGAALDVVVLTPDQMLELRKEMPEVLQGSVFVEVDLTEAIAVVRSFVPDETWSVLAGQFADGATCDLL